VGEFIGPLSKYLHYGLTSRISSILPWPPLKEASDIIINDLHRLLKVLKEKASQHKETLMIGRTHGVHAEPSPLASNGSLVDETKRNLSRMERAKEAVSVVRYPVRWNICPYPSFVEEFVCGRLGLKPAPISTQIVQRDHHAEFFTTLAIMASSIEKFSVELRHLQRTEVLEAEEFLLQGAEGILPCPTRGIPSPRRTCPAWHGLVRSYSLAALENSLWHERTSATLLWKRVIAPDATILIDYMLPFYLHRRKPDRLSEKYGSEPGRMGGSSIQRRSFLLLTKKGLRESYRVVAKECDESLGEGEDFKPFSLRMRDETDPHPEGIRCGLRCPKPLQHVDEIFRRVFGRFLNEEGSKTHLQI